MLENAELDGILCSGALIDGRQTYALLDQRVPQTKHYSDDEALAMLAQRYFSSHAPATLADFVWWSGLNVGKAKRAMQLIDAELASETINQQTYFALKSNPVVTSHVDSVHAIPAFDELIISYKDRSAMLDSEVHAQLISSNGMFYPAIMVNGVVQGLWKRTIKKQQIVIETNFLKPFDPTLQPLLDAQWQRYREFLGVNGKQ